MALLYYRYQIDVDESLPLEIDGDSGESNVFASDEHLERTGVRPGFRRLESPVSSSVGGGSNAHGSVSAHRFADGFTAEKRSKSGRSENRSEIGN